MKLFSQYVTENVLYYYKNYIMKCKREELPLRIRPNAFYYLQPLFLYFYSIAFTHRSFFFTFLFLELFYSFGKSGDLVNKNPQITYSNDVSSYKIMKFFNHSAFHLIFYLKLFYQKCEDPSYKYLLVTLLHLFQLGMYIHKSYRRRYDYIQLLKETPENRLSVIYPSYYKIPILTSDEKSIEKVVKYTSFFTSESYYFYLFGFIHFCLFG